jgi:hypothetical protein
VEDVEGVLHVVETFSLVRLHLLARPDHELARRLLVP